MLTPAAGLIMDMVLMGLLLAALWFGVRLNARLKTLRGGQEDFIRAVAELDQAAIKAHASLRELHANADESQELLHGRILAARDLLGRLEAQISRAERARRELEEEVIPVLTRVPEPAPTPAARLEQRPDPDPDAEPLALRSRTQARDNWAPARGAQAHQTYAGRGRPAYEEEADDPPAPVSRRLRDLNDRFAGMGDRRAAGAASGDEVSDDEANAHVSTLGLQAINEMLSALAGPEKIAATAPEPVRERRQTPDLNDEGRRMEPARRPVARTRLPSALDRELFDADAPEVPPAPVAARETAASRPLFRRLR